MPVILSSYRLGPGQRASYKTVPPPWDWLLRRENELGPRRSKSQIIFAVLVPPLYVAVQAPALIVTVQAISTRKDKRFEAPNKCFLVIGGKLSLVFHTVNYSEWLEIVYQVWWLIIFKPFVLSASFKQSNKLSKRSAK